MTASLGLAKICPKVWKQFNKHLEQFGTFTLWLQVDLAQLSATQCVVSWQSAYWRKCQVTKCSSRFEEIFWILERFLGCKLFSIFMLFVDLWIKPGFDLFFRSDKLFKSDLSERCQFLIFFRICKIFLDCSFTAFVGFCFYRSSNHRLNCWGYRKFCTVQLKLNILFCLVYHSLSEGPKRS